MSNDTAECGCEGHVSNFDACKYPALLNRVAVLEQEVARWKAEHAAMAIQAKDARETRRAVEQPQCTCHMLQRDTQWHDTDCPRSPVYRDKCSTTCTHDDARTPGHAERVKERDEAFNAQINAGLNAAHEQGAEAMRASCLTVVQFEMEKRGASREEWESMKSAIEGATP